MIKLGNIENKDKVKDSLYSYLFKLKVDDIDDAYKFYLKEGLTRREDIKRYLYDFVNVTDFDVSDEQIIDLLDYYRDISKQDKQLKTHLKTVIHLAYAFHILHDKLPLEDLVQTANLGYLLAIKKYDKKSGLPFADYLNYYCITNMINDYEKEKKEWKK